LGASSQSIRNWVRDGRLAGVRIGNRFLIPRSEVERMRGTASGPVGESPWAFADDVEPVPLPRARDPRSGLGAADRMLGG